jgi:glycosyltransferase involved in cell wall biosynthesis
VSVVVPTYGRPEFLPDALRSVGAQTYDDVELIVVDDHSPDPVEPLVDDLALDVESVRVFRHDENRGANAARNTGIGAASGEFVAFLDDDDWWEQGYLDAVVDVFDDPAVGLVSVGARVVDDQGTVLGTHTPQFSGDPIDALLEGTQAGSFSRFVVRADAIETAGLLDEELPSWQDWEWQFRLARYYQFGSVPALLVNRRVGEHDQITDEFETRRDVSYPTLLARHREYIASRGPEDERRFVGVLTRSLAASALSNGAYRSGLRYLLHAIRTDPFGTDAYPLLLAAIGGPLTYRPARYLKRRTGSDSV